MRLVFSLVLGVGIFLGVASRQAWAIGSIAYDESSGGWGYSYDFSSIEEARAGARQECAKHGNSNCNIVITFNTCGAVTTGSNGVYWGVGQSDHLAQARAMSACTKDDSRECKVIAWACNTPPSPPLAVDTPNWSRMQEEQEQRDRESCESGGGYYGMNGVYRSGQCQPY